MEIEKLLFLAQRNLNTQHFLYTIGDAELEEIAQKLISLLPVRKGADKETDPNEEVLRNFQDFVMSEFQRRDREKATAGWKATFKMSDEELLLQARRIKSNPKAISIISESDLRQLGEELVRRDPPNGRTFSVVISGTPEYEFSKLYAVVMEEIKRRDEDAENQILSNHNNEIPTQLVQDSNFVLNSRYGTKTNLLRVLDALWELRFFVKKDGDGAITRTELMDAFGRLLNEDMSNFESQLSQSYHYTKVETNLEIFDEMKAKIQQKCIPK